MYKVLGRIARINLTKKEATIFDSEDYYKWLGGRGFGSNVIFNEVDKGTDPLSENNKIVIATGCLTGTSMPGSSRIALCTKNVLNNGISYSSGGGNLGPSLKKSGFDAIILEGKSNSPVYLYLHDDKVEIRDAKQLWGKTTWDTEDLIKKELNDKDIHVASIGPAGENLVKTSCVIIDKAHALAWGGSGAVMGSKNLKAIAAKATKNIEYYHQNKFNQISDNYSWILKSSSASDALRKGGTHGMAGVGGWSGKVPTSVRNLQEEYWKPEKSSKINGDAFKKYSKNRTNCYNCPLYCLNWYEFENENETLIGEGMHANSVRGFGSNWDIDDPYSVLKAHLLCNQLGLDVDGVSSSIAFAIECYENSLIDSKDTHDLILKWGNAPDLLKLIENIAYRKDFGDTLAEGVCISSKIIGPSSKKYAMQTKSVGINEQGVHSHKAWSFAIAVSTRGGGHLSGAPQTENRQISRNTSQWLFGEPNYGDPVSYEKKGKLVAWYEKYKAIIDSIGICYFDAGWYEVSLADIKHYVDLFYEKTSIKLSKDEMWEIASRIINIEKAFNSVHAGFTRSDDTLPKRVMTQPLSIGPYKGELMNQDFFNIMLNEYYEEQRWDIRTGLQKRDMLIEIGMSEIADYLQKNNALIE